ncbi:flagellin, partial [Pseudomonadales bacterium]|nr:flagellin [Pseudomonadales bacterium]
AADRQYLQGEVSSLIQEMDRVATQTQYNGQNLLDGTMSGKIQAGSESNQTINFNLKALNSEALGGVSSLLPSDAVWQQLGEDIDAEAEYDQNGYSVSLSNDGTVIAIGAPGNDGNGSDAGRVRLYAWDGSSWRQRGADIDGEAADDLSGGSVSLSSDGRVVAVGAQYNDGNSTDAGHVRLYTWDGSSWTQRGTDIDGEAAGDLSGRSVSLSSDGSVVAVGATSGLVNSNGPDAGHVRLYAWDGSSWTQRGADIDAEADGDVSGTSVSLSSDGSVVAIGASRNDGNGANAGHVRLYAWDGSNWMQRGADIDGEAAGDESGFSVSLSSDGSVVAIGAQYNDGNSTDAGHVRLYTWDGSSWLQRGTDIDDEPWRSGYSVSLSSDGSVVAIGAPYNGPMAGHVRLYAWDGSNWTQRGADIDGEAAGDKSGGSVSLSSDGSVVAIGAPWNDAHFGSYSYAGHVRIFTLPPSESLAGINLADTSSLIDAITAITAAIEKVSDQRAEYGALQNRLNYTISNLLGTVEATEVSRSRIEDADFAVEAANLAKAQVLQQAGTVMLAQANAQPQLVLSLIKS